MIGKEILGYTIESVLGEGGMATVYKGVNQQTNHSLAFKVLDNKLTSSESLMTRFRNEATLGINLDHPYIAKVFNFIKDENVPMILMENIDGCSIAQYFKDRKCNLSEKIEVFIKVLNAFGYAHSLKVVHRDIKPSNIIVDKWGNPKVLDFGIARIDTQEGVGLTRTGAHMGSLPYMSPEQIKGIKNIDKKTDIYSLGLLLYELISEKPVFDSETENSYLLPTKIMNDAVPKIEGAAYARINQIIKKATNKSPEDRYSSCKAFKSELLDNEVFKDIEGSNKNDEPKFPKSVYQAYLEVTKEDAVNNDPDPEYFSRSEFKAAIIIGCVVLLLFLMSQ